MSCLISIPRSGHKAQCFQRFCHNQFFVELSLHQRAAAAAHFRLFGKAHPGNAAHCLGQARRIPDRAEVSALAVLHRLAAAGDVAGDQRTAGGCALQQYVV